MVDNTRENDDSDIWYLARCTIVANLNKIKQNFHQNGRGLGHMTLRKCAYPQTYLQKQ